MPLPSPDAHIITLDDAKTLPPHGLPARVGGKAAGLASVRRWNLPTPDGFVVTVAAYRHFVATALRGASTTASIQQAFASAPLPEALERDVRAAFERLQQARGPCEVAVRSSATDEDATAQSFAGQQATVLGVDGAEALLDAIRRVWASIFDQQSLLYRSQMSLEGLPPGMAVLVQCQLAPRAAGVCFSVNPVSGAADEMVISSAFGLGETVVSGGASDTFYLRRSDGAITRRELVGPPSLSDADLARISNLAGQIEDRVGRPVDIEWAFDGEGGLWILQTRPITHNRELAAPPEVWTNINVGEALPGVGTPMTWSIIRSFARRGFLQAFGALGLDVPDDYALVGSFRGRVFLNLSQFASIITQIPVMSPATLLAMAGGPSAFEVEGTITRHSPAGFLKRLPLTIPRMLGSHVAMPFMAPRWARTLRDLRDAFHQRDLKRLSRAELRGVLDHVDATFDKTGLVMLSVSSNFLSSYVLTRELLKRWGGPDAAQRENQLFTGLTNLRSAEPGLDLLRMAHHVRQHPALERFLLDTTAEALAGAPGALDTQPGGARLRAMLETFFTEHGHRAPREAEIATPRWREAPTFVYDTLKTYLRAPWLPDPEHIASEQEVLRRQATEAIRRHFTTGLGLFFRQILRLTQANARMREDLRACVVDTLGMYRHVFVEVGRRMVEDGLIGDAEDVFFLTHDEVRDFLSGAPTSDYPVRAAIRRTLYDAFCTLPDPPDTFTLVGGTIRSTAPEPEGERDLLRGLPGSPGRVTGHARVILDANAPDARLEPGDVLVAPFTDVGWTPLFLVASAVVMAKGGPLSHSCIVAREYGIPAAVNVVGATDRIKTGDLITVDGDTGIVYLAREKG